MKCKFLTVASILLILVLAACAQPTNVAPTNSVASPTTVTPTDSATEPQQSKPEAGKATLIGKVVSLRDGLPMANTVVRLAEVFRQGDEGAFVLDGAYSPGDITDEQGRFAIENVDVKEYVIVVGDVYDKYQIIGEPDNSAKVFQAVEDEILDVGELQVDLTK
jgi:hypothetical protein